MIQVTEIPNLIIEWFIRWSFDIVWSLMLGICDLEGDYV